MLLCSPINVALGSEIGAFQMLVNELMRNECVYISDTWQCNHGFFGVFFLVACLFLNYMLLNF
jgi:hypothetical protein